MDDGKNHSLLFHQEDLMFKVVVLGEPGVGKTSLIRRYVHGEFLNNKKYQSTIGVDFALKQLAWRDNTNRERIVRLQFWDIAGQERFGLMTQLYYREAAGACILFDVSEPMKKSFSAVERWKNDLESKVSLPNGAKLPCILLANKCDLLPDGGSGLLSWCNNINNFDSKTLVYPPSSSSPPSSFSSSSSAGYADDSLMDGNFLDEFSSGLGFEGWGAISARTGDGIEGAMNIFLASLMSQSHLWENFRRDDASFRLTSLHCHTKFSAAPLPPTKNPLFSCCHD